MIYVADQPILIVCDTKKKTEITDREIEQVNSDLIETLKSFIEQNTEFDPFSADIMYSNLDSRLNGDQFLFSTAVGYLTESNLGASKFHYIEELDKKDFLRLLKSTKSYDIMDNIMELDTFIIDAGEYKNICFYAEMNSKYGERR